MQFFSNSLIGWANTKIEIEKRNPNQTLISLYLLPRERHPSKNPPLLRWVKLHFRPSLSQQSPQSTLLLYWRSPFSFSPFPSSVICKIHIVIVKFWLLADNLKWFLCCALIIGISNHANQRKPQFHLDLHLDKRFFVFDFYCLCLDFRILFDTVIFASIVI